MTKCDGILNDKEIGVKKQKRETEKQNKEKRMRESGLSWEYTMIRKSKTKHKTRKNQPGFIEAFQQISQSPCCITSYIIRAAQALVSMCSCPMTSIPVSKVCDPMCGKKNNKGCCIHTLHAAKREEERSACREAERKKSIFRKS